MVGSLMYAVPFLIFVFGASALRPIEMDTDTQLLKTEDIEHKSDMSSFAELKPVEDPRAFRDAVHTYLFNMGLAAEIIINPNDPEGQACSFFHSAARQALSRAFKALVSSDPTGGNSFLRILQTEEVDEEDRLTRAEQDILRALLAMERRVMFIYNLLETDLTALNGAIDSAESDPTTKQNKINERADKLQRTLLGIVNLFKMDTPEKMDQGFVVPIYVLWRRQDAFQTLMEKIKKLKITYDKMVENDQQERFNLKDDLTYLCTVVTNPSSRERTETGDLPLPTYHPSPFIKFAKYDLEHIWPTGDVAVLGPFPEASFTPSGTAGPQNWDTSSMNKAVRKYAFPVL